MKIVLEQRYLGMIAPVDMKNITIINKKKKIQYRDTIISKTIFVTAKILIL